METAITAPFAGTVHAVSVSVNTQVEAGAPLVQLRPSDPSPAIRPRPAPRLDLPRWPIRDAPAGHASPATLRSYLLGYDLDDSCRRQLTRRQRPCSTRPATPTPTCSARSRNCWRSSPTSPRWPGASLTRRESELSRSAEDYLFTYLATLDPERSGAAGAFPQASCGMRWPATASPRCGARPNSSRRCCACTGRSPGSPSSRPLIMAILDRWLRRRDTLMALMTDERLRSSTA